MAVSRDASLCALCLGALAMGANAMDAPAPSSADAYTWSADVLNSDFRSDTLDLAGNVRVAQGPLSIEAQAAMAKNFRSDDSEWTFKENVQIRTAQAELTSNVAVASFQDGELRTARITGTPAEFQQRDGADEERVRGRAEMIEYDFGTGVVRMRGDVWFSNGKDEFRGDLVVYDVREERVQINPGGHSPGRVRGVIRPQPAANDDRAAAPINDGDENGA